MIENKTINSNEKQLPFQCVMAMFNDDESNSTTCKVKDNKIMLLQTENQILKKNSNILSEEIGNQVEKELKYQKQIDDLETELKKITKTGKIDSKSISFSPQIIPNIINNEKILPIQLLIDDPIIPVESKHKVSLLDEIVKQPYIDIETNTKPIEFNDEEKGIIQAVEKLKKMNTNAPKHLLINMINKKVTEINLLPTSKDKILDYFNLHEDINNNNKLIKKENKPAQFQNALKSMSRLVVSNLPQNVIKTTKLIDSSEKQYSMGLVIIYKSIEKLETDRSEISQKYKQKILSLDREYLETDEFKIIKEFINNGKSNIKVITSNIKAKTDIDNLYLDIVKDDMSPIVDILLELNDNIYVFDSILPDTIKYASFVKIIKTYLPTIKLLKTLVFEYCQYNIEGTKGQFFNDTNIVDTLEFSQFIRKLLTKITIKDDSNIERKIIVINGISQNIFESSNLNYYNLDIQFLNFMINNLSFYLEKMEINDSILSNTSHIDMKIIVSKKFQSIIPNLIENISKLIKTYNKDEKNPSLISASVISLYPNFIIKANNMLNNFQILQNKLQKLYTLIETDMKVIKEQLVFSETTENADVILQIFNFLFKLLPTTTTSNKRIIRSK